MAPDAFSQPRLQARLKSVVQKVSWDKKSFMNIPHDFHSPENHPLVQRHPKYRDLLMKLQSNPKGFQESEGYRNLKMEIIKKGVRSEEAIEYLNEKNEFQFKGVPLTAEPTKMLDPLDANFQSPTTYSGQHIMQILSKFTL